MKLGIKDRFLIQGLMPRESNLVNQILAKDIMKKTEITQQDLLEIEAKNVDYPSGGSGVTWNDKKAAEKILDVEFTDAERNFLKKQVDRLDQEQKISQENLELCKMIKEG